MPSRKDKLTKKIQEEVKKNISYNLENSEYKQLINEITENTKENKNIQEKKEEIQELTDQKKNFDESIKKNQDKLNNLKNTESMSKKRDSIYNISADLRLEDYVEDNQKKEYTPIIKNIAIFLLILLLIAGIWKIGLWLFSPNYYLSIANTEITEDNYKSFLNNKQISLYPGQIIHIRFTYLKKDSDYYSIQILKKEGGTLTEEAILGRKIPKTVNFIYFAGPLDAGSYLVKVLNRERETIIEREIEVINP